MNKAELVKALSEESGMTIRGSEKFLSAFVGVVTETLKKSEDVQFVGFGSFSVVKRAARIGINFQTKKAVKIPESRGVRFKVGKNLKEAVN